MGFNYFTLLEFPFGLIIPIAAILFFVISKNRKSYAYDAIAYGFGAFLGSLMATAIAFVALNTFFLAGLTFSDDVSGMTIAGTIFSVMIAVLFVFCESFKMMTFKKFFKEEKRTELSSVAFSSGVILAQSGVIFVALNFFDNYEMTAGYAIFSGIIITVTGAMYTVLSFAAEKALKLGSRGAAYAISSVYYIFWIAVIFCVGSPVLMYIVSVLIFVFAFVISAVFLKNGNKIIKKRQKTGE